MSTIKKYLKVKILIRRKIFMVIIMSEKNINLNWTDKKIVGNLTLRTILEVLTLILIVTVGGLLAYCHISNKLNDALEDAVAKNTKTIAYELDKRFKLEMSSLRTRVKMIEDGRFSPATLVDSLMNFDNRRTGIIFPNGNILAGKSIPEQIIDATQKVFDGEDTIRYIHEVGLIFAVPVEIDGQTCVLFDFYDDDAVRKNFNTINFNGDGTVILLNTMQDWIVLADGVTLINTHPDMDEGWEKLGQKAGYDPATNELKTDAAAVFYEFQGEHYFVYFANVSKKHKIAISGYVPWQSVAVGLESIYSVMLLVFCLLIMVILMYGRSAYKSSENRALKHEKFYALQASKTKSEFLSNMSHEIRTPINAILGMDEMILRESKDENILEYAENLRHAGNSLLGIVNDILDFSKIEAGKMEIIPVEYALSSLLNDLVNMVKPRLEKKNLQLETNVNEKIPSILYGDEIRIKQVVTNILTNAVKYTEKGKVTLTVDFETDENNNINLSFSVKDTGIGIKPEDISKLFNAFERIEEKRNRTIEGTGLGMNITQQLLRLMDSKLEVQSVYGEGSTFSFKILQKVINLEPIGDFAESFRNSLKNHETYHEKFTAPDAKILVVDDTIMNLTVVKGLLKQTKIKIDTAESGYECLDLVMKNRYDIIFLDHRMPGMDGIETLQKMRNLTVNLNKSTPVISLTANAISGAREQYIAAGFEDYLTKPINSVALENMIIKYLPKNLVQIVTDEPAEVEENLNLPDWLGKIQNLDVKAGIEHCGDAELYLDALKVFAEGIKTGADEIQRYFDEKNWKNYTTKVHALKSSARVIGANELSDRARRLEDAGNSNYIDEIENFTPQLLELYRSYSEKLLPLIEVEVDDTDKPPIDEDALAEAYETLREVAGSFDYDSLQFVLQSLEDYKLPPADAEKISEIKSAANQLDWEKINKLLEG